MQSPVKNGDGCKLRLSLAIAGLQHFIGARKHLRGPTRQGGPPRRPELGPLSPPAKCAGEKNTDFSASRTS